MGQTFAILFSDDVDPAAVFSIVDSLGGEIVDAALPEARLSSDQDHLWIFPSNDIVEDLEPDELALLGRALGKAPASAFAIESTETPRSSDMLVDFALACASAWPCVLYDLEGHASDREELSKLKAEHRSLYR